jgi:D-alanyl-lipoteichoic acid acyltransferase DltB (MBOAT superfamily)
MLFNSYEFLFAFLPVTLLVFLLLGRASRNLALGWLIVASLIFYAWWRPINVPIIGISLAVNFTLARWLQHTDERRSRWRVFILTLGIVFNVVFLGYFKYSNFILSAVNDLTGTDFVLIHIVLPLGISFITFQKIAFLVDVQAGRVESFTLRDYLLFVLFFPQLIAGPIVHYREMMPQFHSNPCRFDKEAMGVGLTMITFGLFKKVVLADGMASYVTPIYTLASGGAAISLIPAWVAAIGFTLQLYFDFSGYSDMAAGLARCFGVRLPLNFYSPLQAGSVIDFWSRWHVTLTRFLTAYLYNPLVLWLTRRRFARGLPGLGGRNASLGAFLQLLAGPTLLTMFISGFWHGAGYLFILWGLLHGVYLVINHAWRLVGPKLWASKESYLRFMRPVGFVLTFFAVALGMVLFRSPTVHVAVDVFRGILGLHGVEFPRVLAEKLAARGLPLHFVSIAEGLSTKDFLAMLLWTLVLLLIALTLPNSIQIMARHQPVLGAMERPANTGLARLAMNWNPTLGWAIVMSLMAAAAIMRVGGPSEFLYWQF